MINSNGLFAGTTPIKMLAVGSNTGQTNYGINVYNGDAYVTTLFPISYDEALQICTKKYGEGAIFIGETMCNYDFMYQGGGSPYYSINKMTGAIIGPGGEKTAFVTSLDIAKRCVEYAMCRGGRMMVESINTRAGSGEADYHFRVINLCTGTAMYYGVTIYGYVIIE